MRQLLAICALCLAFPAPADVYRWVDDNGQVHYGERPPLEGADRVDLPTREAAPTNQDADAARRRERQQRLLNAYEYERAQKKADAARLAEQQRADAERCRVLQQRWRRLSHGGPVYIRRADGGRDFLSEQQRAAEKTRMRPAYAEACGRPPE